MREIDICHRCVGEGYLLMIKRVQEAILMEADDLLTIADWCVEHREELERESQGRHDEHARRLLDE